MAPWRNADGRQKEMSVTVQHVVRRAVGTAMFLAAVAAAAPALAQDGGGYVAVGGGFAHRQKAGENPQTYVLFKNGYAFNIAAGGQMKSGLAVEGEFSHFNNGARIVSSPATGPDTGVGSVSLNFFFGNLRYTVPTGPVRIYLGGGLGGYKSTLNDLSNTIAESFGFVANGTSDSITF